MVKRFLMGAAVAVFGLQLAACDSLKVEPSAVNSEPAAPKREIQHWQTANGAQVYFAQARQLPIVDARVVFSAGAARDGEQLGVAKLTASALRSGAAEMDAGAIAERLESVGAQLNVDAMRDMAWASFRSLSSERELNEASDVMAELLARPSFPQGEIDRLKNQMLVSVRNAAQDPGEVANRVFFRELYGDHPYGRSVDEADVERLDRAAVQAFHQRYYVARNAVVAIVGDLDRAAAEALADKLTRGLAAGEKPAAVPEVPALESGKTVRVPFPSQQSHVLVGQPGLRRGDADYFSLYLGNHVLGGSGFASRLVGEVREKRGLAYSVYSYFMPMAQNGPFQMGLQTRGDQAELAESLVRGELQRFIDDGPTAEELESARLNVTGSSPLRADSNRKLVEYLAVIGFYDLPLDYLDSFNAQINRQTLASVRDAFERRVHPDKLVTVIVGGGQE